MNEKPYLVIDLGRTYIKIGFSGELSPREIIPSPLFIKLYSDRIPVNWHQIFTQLFRIIYEKIAPCRPREHGVFILEPLIGFTTQCREALMRVLYDEYLIPKLIIYPSSLAALYTTGLGTGLIIDIGSVECTITPIFEGYPIFSSFKTFPIGTIQLGIRLKELIEEEENNDEILSFTKQIQNLINSGFYDDLLKSNDSLYNEIYHNTFNMITSQFDSKQENLKLNIIKENNGDEDDIYFESRHHILKEQIKKNNCFHINNLSFNDIENILFQSCYFTCESLENDNISNINFQLKNGNILNLQNNIRIESTNLLFHADGEKGLHEIILDTLLSIPIDLRRSMCSHIILTGGGSLLTGLGYRLTEEIVNLANNPNALEKYQNLKNLFISKDDIFIPESPFPNHLINWIGGSLMATSELLTDYSISNDEFQVIKTNNKIIDIFSSNPKDWHFIVPKNILNHLEDIPEFKNIENNINENDNDQIDENDIEIEMKEENI